MAVGNVLTDVGLMCVVSIVYWVNYNRRASYSSLAVRVRGRV